MFFSTSYKIYGFSRAQPQESIPLTWLMIWFSLHFADIRIEMIVLATGAITNDSHKTISL